MGWIDQMSLGMKDRLQKDLAELRGELGDPLARKARFWIRDGYQGTVATVRDLAEYFWFSKDYCNKQAKYRPYYDAVLEDCHWANHHPDEEKFPIYPVTDDNQGRLVVNLWYLLSECGAISLPEGVPSGSELMRDSLLCKAFKGVSLR